MNDLEVKEIENEVILKRSDALSLTVVSNETYSQAGELLVMHKGLKKRIEDYFKPLKDAGYKAWKAICNRENEEIEKLQPALKHLNAELVKWNNEQERIRKAEEDRLRWEAEKAEEERRLANALQAEKEGKKVEAEEILSEPVYVPPPIVEKTVPKINGQTMTTNWKWRLKDINLVPRQYLITNDVAINQVVRALKDKTNISGIEIYPEQAMKGVRQ